MADVSLKRDVLLPVITGILAIVLERWLFRHSAAERRLVGAEPGD